MRKTVILLWLVFVWNASCTQPYSRGVLPGHDADYEQIALKAPLTRSFYEGAPYSSSLKQYAPTPASQGKYNTCTGWAVAYAARTIVEAKKQGWTSKSTITHNAFSPTYQYRQASDKYDCRGARTSEVVQSLKTVGSVPKAEFYVGSGEALCPPAPLHSSNDIKAESYKIDEYATLWSYQYDYDYGKVGKVKTSLSEGSPVVIAMICPDSFDKIGSSGLWSPTESPTDDTDGRQHGRHALCVIGYDNGKFGGAFEIQNSWGTDWGNKGYCWIKYNDFSKFVYQAYEVVQFPEPRPEEPLLAGSLRLYDLDDEKNLEVSLAGATRNWNIEGPGHDGQYTYKVVPSLLSGSEMRMYLKSEQPAYVYMLGTGAVDKTVLTLFPVDGISPAMNYHDYEVALPSEEHYFKMDQTTGKNYIIVLFSKDKLAISNIRNKLATGGGTLGQKLKKVIGNSLIAFEQIKFSQDRIKFEVAQNSSGKTAFAMIIEFNQVK